MDEISFRQFSPKKRINEHKSQRSRQNAFFSRNSVTMLQSAKTIGTMMYQLAGGTTENTNRVPGTASYW